MKKSTVLTTLQEFPKEFELEVLLERLIVLEKIEEGLEDVKKGNVIAHENVKQLVKKWRK